MKDADGNNKYNIIDLLLDEEAEELKNEICEALDWQGEVFSISAFNKMGTEALQKNVGVATRRHDASNPQDAMDVRAPNSQHISMLAFKEVWKAAHQKMAIARKKMSVAIQPKHKRY